MSEESRPGEPFAQIWKAWLAPLQPCPATVRFLTLMQDPTTAIAPVLAPTLEEDPEIHSAFDRLDVLAKRKKAWGQEAAVAPKPGDPPPPPPRLTPGLDLLTLFGRTFVRETLLAFDTQRTAGTPLFTPPKGGGEPPPIVLKARDIVPRAGLVADLCGEKNYAYAEMNLVGGLLFDRVEAIAKGRKLLSRPAQEVIEAVWKEGLRAAVIAYRLGTFLPTFKYNRYAMSSALVSALGPALAAILYPAAGTLGARGSYPTWWKNSRKLLAAAAAAPPRKPGAAPAAAAPAAGGQPAAAAAKADPVACEAVLLAEEDKLFPIAPRELAALAAASLTRLLLPIEKAVYFASEPYVLRKRHPDLFRLAVLLDSSARLARWETEGKKPATAWEALGEGRRERLLEIQINAAQVTASLG